MHVKDARILDKFAGMTDAESGKQRPNQSALSVLLTLVFLILSTNGCGGGYSNPTRTSSSLVAIFVNASSIPSIEPGETIQLSASGVYRSSVPGGLSSKEVTKSATWSTSNAAVATVTGGLVIGTGVGPVTITATLGGQTASTTVVVGLSSTIAITPSGVDPFSKSLTSQQQFVATATYSDGTVLDVTDFEKWRSNPTGVVSFYLYFPGNATFLAPGTTTITATLNTGDIATDTITVVT
jgi:hypothetical protein